MSQYVYLQSEPNLFTVGFYDPQGKWQPEFDTNDRTVAANRVAFLNGSIVGTVGELTKQRDLLLKGCKAVRDHKLTVDGYSTEDYIRAAIDRCK